MAIASESFSLSVRFVYGAVATPRKARVSQPHVPVIGSVEALVLAYAAEQAPLALSYEDGRPVEVRRVGDRWYASMSTLPMHRDGGPFDLGWLRAVCDDLDMNPFDGTGAHAFGRPLGDPRPPDAFRQVDGPPGHRIEAIHKSLDAVAIIGGTVMREVSGPVLQAMGDVVRVIVDDVEPLTGYLRPGRIADGVMTHSAACCYSLADVGQMTDRERASLPGMRLGDAPPPATLVPRVALAHLDMLYQVARSVVADGDAEFFSRYERLRDALGRCRSHVFGRDVLDDFETYDLMRSSILDGEASVSAAIPGWNGDLGIKAVARIEAVTPEMALLDFEA